METPSYLRNKADEKYFKGVFSFHFCGSFAREKVSLLSLLKTKSLHLKIKWMRLKKENQR